jgi:hypothetical protein
MTPWFRIACIAASSLILAWGSVAAGYPLVAPWIALLGLLWIAAGRSWAPAGYVGLALVLLAAATGMLLRVSPPLLLLASVLGLAAWDLEHFVQRLPLAAGQVDVGALEKRHYLRLAMVLLGAASLGLAADLLHGVRISFETAAGLAILAAWGLTYLVVRLRRAR